MLAEREIHNMTGIRMLVMGFRFSGSLAKERNWYYRFRAAGLSIFIPIWLAVIKEENEEATNLAFSLYSAGLTTGEVSKIFARVYGRRYSTSHISRMFDFARDKVREWLQRPLVPYYPIIYVDAVCYSHSTRRFGSKGSILHHFRCSFGPYAWGFGPLLQAAGESEGWREIFEGLRSLA